MIIMKHRTAEIAAGYTMLVIGLFFIIFPAALALLVFLSGMEVPQLVPFVTAQSDSVAASLNVLSNVLLVLFLFGLAIWAGSIITTRGVTMIKDVRLKLMGQSIKEANVAVDKVDRKKD